MSVNAPGAAVGGLGFSAGQSIRDLLLERPGIAVPVPALAASLLISSRPSILLGWSLRETVGGGGQTFLSASSANAAAANNVALPAGAAGTENWVTGFEITGGGATGASVITVTLVGVAGGTKTYKIAVPAGAALGISPLVVEFPAPGLPAAALAAAITLNVPSFGAGNTDAAATINGYQVASAPAAGSGSLGAPAAIFDLLEGTDANGSPIAALSLVAGGMSAEMPLSDGPLCRGGIFLKRTSGILTGAVWVKQ